MVTTIDKALVAVVMEALALLNLFWAVDSHVVLTIGVILAVLTPLLVWFVPNLPPSRFR